MTKTIAVFPVMQREEIEQVINSASAAQKQWNKTPAPVRGELLLKIAQLLEERTEEWGEACY